MSRFDFDKSTAQDFVQSAAFDRNRFSSNITDSAYEILELLGISPVQEDSSYSTSANPAWARDPGGPNNVGGPENLPIFNAMTWTDIVPYDGSFPFEPIPNPTNDPFPGVQSFHERLAVKNLPPTFFPPSLPADNESNAIWPPLSDVSGNEYQASIWSISRDQASAIVAVPTPDGKFTSVELFKNRGLQGAFNYGQTSYWYYAPTPTGNDGRPFWENEIILRRERIIFKGGTKRGFVGQADLRACNDWNVTAPNEFYFGFGKAPPLDNYGHYTFIAATNFRVLHASVTVPNLTWYETPFNPGGGDLAYPGAPSAGWYGRLWFVAFDETPAQWSARTGVVIS